jgi:hypothetical protein
MNDDTNEPRAEVLFQPSWVFRVYKQDAELILRALGGRIQSEEDRAACRELGDRLTALRAQGVAQMNVGHTIAVTNMQAAREKDGLDPDPLKRK